MKVCDFLVNSLINRGVTDVFGIPGCVVLDFLYALKRRDKEISAHLNFHEQASAFAAVGYAQVNTTLGCAYATRGPGLTNMITAIADAYYSCVPVVFVSAHSKIFTPSNKLFEVEQEFDTVKMISDITKMAVRIEDIESAQEKIEHALSVAVSGRPGPVFIDFLEELWQGEL